MNRSLLVSACLLAAATVSRAAEPVIENTAAPGSRFAEVAAMVKRGGQRPTHGFADALLAIGAPAPVPQFINLPVG